MKPFFYKDHDNSVEASFIFSGDTEHHEFDAAEDEDWFIFYGEGGRSHVFEIENRDVRCEPVITLYNAKFETLKRTDKGEYRLEWRCRGEETFYFAKVTNTDGSVYGDDTGYDFHFYVTSAPFSTGQIFGYVCDAHSYSKRIQGVDIIYVNVGNGIVREDVYYSNSLGICYMSGLEKGNYTLIVNAPGYKESQVTVIVGSLPIRKDICLWPE